MVNRGRGFKAGKKIVDWVFFISSVTKNTRLNIISGANSSLWCPVLLQAVSHYWLHIHSHRHWLNHGVIYLVTYFSQLLYCSFTHIDTRQSNTEIYPNTICIDSGIFGIRLFFKNHLRSSYLQTGHERRGLIHTL